MPNQKSHLSINLDLLKPQSNPEKLPFRFFRWLLSTGRYIFVFVEALVLIAFGARFKLDADLAAKKDAIEQQIPYIESLKLYEILIRNTQLKLSTIGNIKNNSQDWSIILKKIADQTPTNIKITGINIEKGNNNAAIHLTGQTQNSGDLTNFIAGLTQETTFANVNLANVSLEQGVIKFSINASANITSSAQTNL